MEFNSKYLIYNANSDKLKFLSGKEDDLPTEILEGALSFKPDIFNPLLQKGRFKGDSRGKKRSYLSNLKKEPPSLPYRHNLRKEDKPGCGPPICSIIDMRVKTFKSMCHMVEYLIQNGRYRTIFDVQKGSCEEASKYNYLFHLFLIDS